MTYSLSAENGEPTSALKVLYRSIDPGHPVGEGLTKAQLQIEELCLPETLERMLFEQLHISTQILPHSVRHFQDWSVALLPKQTDVQTPSI